MLSKKEKILDVRQKYFELYCPNADQTIYIFFDNLLLENHFTNHCNFDVDGKLRKPNFVAVLKLGQCTQCWRVLLTSLYLYSNFFYNYIHILCSPLQLIFSKLKYLILAHTSEYWKVFIYFECQNNICTESLFFCLIMTKLKEKRVWRSI